MPKDELVQARVTHEQKKAVAHAAAKRKLKESTWVREWIEYGLGVDLSTNDNA